jgi:hypothetical protein
MSAGACRVSWIVSACGVAFALATPAPASPQEPGVAKPSFVTLLERAASMPVDWCEAPPQADGDIEKAILQSAEAEVLGRLNEDSPGPGASSESEALARAQSVLAELGRASTRVNANWPEEARFRGEALAIAPLVLVTSRFRFQAALSVFAIAADARDGRPRWRRLGDPSDAAPTERPSSSLEVFSIARGPSGRARFLVRKQFSGCAGSVGLSYRLLEWDPRYSGWFETVIAVDGAETWADSTDPKNLSAWFPAAGVLRTTGTKITLPYCWWSPLDTWDNPNLCSADAFDVSGDRVRLLGSVANRPDLLPIARVITHAQARDYRAVLAYCRSPAVARRVMRELPMPTFPDNLTVVRLGPGKESVDVGFDEPVQFVVERLRGVWTITRFHFAPLRASVTAERRTPRS